jgi:hypothetical protein
MLESVADPLLSPSGFSAPRNMQTGQGALVSGTSVPQNWHVRLFSAFMGSTALVQERLLLTRGRGPPNCAKSANAVR